MNREHTNRPLGIWAALTTVAALFALAAGLLLAAPAEAQEPRIAELRIWVQDMHTKEDLDFLAPGSTLFLNEGDKVRLRIQAIPADSNRRPRYPRARWTPAGSQQEVRFSEFDERVGTVVVTAVRSNPNVRTGVRFQLLDRMNLVRGVNPNGNLLIEVGRGGQQSGNFPGTRPGAGQSQGEEVARALYQGILLREPDRRGLQGRADAIDEGGFGAALREAQAIAESRESRIEVYSRGTSNEQRLIALFEHLMGVDSQRIDRRDWDDNLRLLSQGDIVGVVTWMLRTEEFRREFGYYTRDYDRRF